MSPNSYDHLPRPKDFICLPRHDYDYDLAVIGSGPAGQKAAITAAKLGARVAMIHLGEQAGGACLNTATIPSKSFREAVVHLTGYRQRGYYGEKYRATDKIQANDLVERTNHVISSERKDINDELRENGIDQIVGFGRMEDEHTILVESSTKSVRCRIKANKTIIATGTRPRRPDDIPFDEVNIFDSDDVFGDGNKLRPLPKSVIVMGAGIIGMEYASMFSALDIPTIILDKRERPLDYVDEEISDLLFDHLKSNGTELVFGEMYKSVKIIGKTRDHNSMVQVELESGRVLEANACLFTMGRIPNSNSLGLENIGIEMTSRGHLVVDKHYKSSSDSIYGAGDVIGHPSLASTSSEQGRVAAMRAFGIPIEHTLEDLPYGIYTIPEISMIGKTEQQLIEEGVDYVVGSALTRSTARGKIIGENSGGLKMLFDQNTRKLLGVHIVGEGATELIHIGQSVFHFGGGIDYFCETVFNYPTLAECYKIAGFNALSRLHGVSKNTDPLIVQMKTEAPRCTI